MIAIEKYKITTSRAAENANVQNAHHTQTHFNDRIPADRILYRVLGTDEAIQTTVRVYRLIIIFCVTKIYIEIIMKTNTVFIVFFNV